MTTLYDINTEYVHIITSDELESNNVFRILISDIQTPINIRLDRVNKYKDSKSKFRICKSYCCYDSIIIEFRIMSLLNKFKIQRTTDCIKLELESLNRIISIICKNEHRLIEEVKKL